MTGEPPDNAGHFIKAIESVSAANAPFSGVRYAVFGCGNRDWVHTFQRIPTLVDTTLSEKGGERLLDRGEADAGGSRFFESFDEWEAKLWPALALVRILLFCHRTKYTNLLNQGIRRCGARENCRGTRYHFVGTDTSSIDFAPPGCEARDRDCQHSSDKTWS